MSNIIEQIQEELSAFECLKDAFEVLKAENQPFAKKDIIKLASEFRANDPFASPLSIRPISLGTFCKSKDPRIQKLSQEADEYTVRWRKLINSQRSSIRKVRPRYPDVPKSARPA